MFNFKKKKDDTYLYLIPAEGDLVNWELINQEELELRVVENRLEEGARLFKIDQEINIRFERKTYLEIPE